VGEVEEQGEAGEVVEGGGMGEGAVLGQVEGVGGVGAACAAGGMGEPGVAMTRTACRRGSGVGRGPRPPPRRRRLA